MKNPSLTQYWLDHYTPHGFCCLCGNWGFFDTRFVLRTPAGTSCGALSYCLCPNGQALRERNVDLEQCVRDKQQQEFLEDRYA